MLTDELTQAQADALKWSRRSLVLLAALIIVSLYALLRPEPPTRAEICVGREGVRATGWMGAAYEWARNRPKQ